MSTKRRAATETLSRQRSKVSLSPALKLKIASEAKACGMPKAKFMRQVLEAAVGDKKAMPRRKRVNDAEPLAHAINNMAIQVKRLGTNVNQLAKQANAGMVAVTRAEVQYVLNQHQQLLSKAIAYFEKSDTC